MHLMWMYNGEDDATRAIRGNFYEGKCMKEMLSLLFKGKAADFLDHKADTGFSTTKSIVHVSSMPHLFRLPVDPRCLS